MTRMTVRSICLTICAILVGLAAGPAAWAQAAPYKAAILYDAGRRVVGTIDPDPDGSGSLGFAAVRNTYDAAGRLIKVEKGQLTTWQDEAAAPTGPAGWSGFAVYLVTTYAYDAFDRKLTESVSSPTDGVVRRLTQYSYDAAGRVQCTAVRMNTAAYGALPASACTLGAQGSLGPDRITLNAYDAAGRLLQVVKAYGVTTANGFPQTLQEAYATYAYNTNGKQTDVIDANGNHAQMGYDGVDRQIQWTFPSTTPASAYNPASQATALATANALNPNDYEAYAYDPDGNRTSLRKRDATVLTYQYDALNRVTAKVVPARTGLPATDSRSVFNAYDLQGHLLTAWFDTATSGQGVTNTFDGFGRQTTSSLTMDAATRLVTYCYDPNGNRILAAYPDSTVGACPAAGASPAGWTNYARYAYDGLDRPLTITTSAGTTVASYAYNPDGTRQSFASNSAAISTSYGYDPIDRLTGLNNTPANTAFGDSFGFAYNPANQITQLNKSNNAFVYHGAVNVNRAYTVNGLNQYSVVGAFAFSYDMNGNLTGDGSNTYLYDVENRLVGAGGTLNAALRYDPLGRLYEVIGSSGVTRFVYGGDELLAEYDGGGQLLRRYVHGADQAADDPIAWYEGATFNSASERLMRPNWQGSIEVVTDTTGQAIYAANTYDEYGIPGSANVGRFQYTGQAWVPELGMYYYKARMYSPTLGRFLQTDPVGYHAGLNLYDYVNDDPNNHADPSGNCGEDVCIVEGIFGVATLSFLVVTDSLTHQCGANCVNTAVDQIKGFVNNFIHKNDQLKGPPSPNGSKGSQAHQDKIKERIEKLKEEGKKHIAGGDLPEETVQTPGGEKESRRPDITMENPDGSRYRENVGRARQDGQPVSREQKAREDIRRATGQCAFAYYCIK